MISAEQIRTARERARLKQSDLAELLGVTERTVSNWENGKHLPARRETQLIEILQIDLAGPPEKVTLLGASDEQLINELARRLLKAPVQMPERRGESAPSHHEEKPERHLRLAADEGQPNVGMDDLPDET